MDIEEDNIPEQIDQEEIPQPVRRSIQYEVPVNILEPTMRGKTYETNNLITQTVQANQHTFVYTTKEATLLGQIFAQAYDLTKGINNFGNKGLDSAL